MYRYAIIGFGGLGKLHLGNLIKLEKERGDIKLCALCGADPESFKSNVRLNIGDVDISSIDFSSCGFYQDYKELIDKEKPDFILSTLPTYLHEEVAVYALSNGVHVFSEKPMALSAESCKNMIDTAKKNNKTLMIGQCLRFDGAYRKIKQYIDEKPFGKVCRAEFTRYSQTPTWTWNNWILDPKMSGGCILDMHIHDVDLINYLFGLPISVSSVITENKIELESVFTRYFYDGFLVTSAADWSFPQSFPFTSGCLINFEKATVRLSDSRLTIYTDDDNRDVELTSRDCYMDEIRAFLEEIFDGKTCKITSAESVSKSISLALCEVESAKIGETIFL